MLCEGGRVEIRERVEVVYDRVVVVFTSGAQLSRRADNSCRRRLSCRVAVRVRSALENAKRLIVNYFFFKLAVNIEEHL